MSFFQPNQYPVLTGKKDVADVGMRCQLGFKNLFTPVFSCQTFAFKCRNHFSLPLGIIIRVDPKVGDKNPSVHILPILIIVMLRLSVLFDRL